MEIKKRKRVKGAFSENPVFDELIHKLTELVCAWRTHKKQELVDRYNHVLLALIELGWDGQDEPLEVQIELPDELLPPEYLALYEDETSIEPEPVTS